METSKMLLSWRSWLHSALISTIALITSSLMYSELKQKFENCSGKSCYGIGVIPKYGVSFNGAFGGKVKLAGIISFSYSIGFSMVLSIIIQFIVLPKSKLTSWTILLVSIGSLNFKYLEALAICNILCCYSESSSGSSELVGILSMKKLYLICESA